MTDPTTAAILDAARTNNTANVDELVAAWERTRPNFDTWWELAAALERIAAATHDTGHRRTISDIIGRIDRAWEHGTTP